MTTVAVADTGPLIHLGEIDAFGLPALVDRLLVPEIVREELDARDLLETLAELDHTVVEADVNPENFDELDPGETAALAVAIERDAVLLTDDLAARERAIQRGIEVRGSIGVVAIGYSRGAVDRDEAASLMRALQRGTRLYVTDAVVERGIEMLDED